MAYTKTIQKHANAVAKLASGHYTRRQPIDGYSTINQQHKNAFLSASRSVLRAMAKEMGLKEFKVSVNKAGPAVSGEATLIGIWEDGHGIYIDLGLSVFGPEFLFRSTTGIKDYTGGRNQWANFAELNNLEKITRQMKQLVNGAAFVA